MSIQLSTSTKPLFETGTLQCLRTGHDWSLPVMRGGGIVQVVRTCRRCGQVEERVQSEYEAEALTTFS